MMWADGRRYVGKWKDGHRSGRGRMYNSDGTCKYDGQWKEGSPSGVGTMVFTDKGAAEADSAVDEEAGGTGAAASAGDAPPVRRSVYTGSFMYGRMHGQGTWA